MGRVRRKTTKRRCEDKRKYSSLEKVTKAISEIAKNTGTPREMLYGYKCNQCNTYHVARNRKNPKSR